MTEQNDAAQPDTGDELDIELEPPQSKRRGCGVGTLIVIVVLAALVAAWIFMAISSQRLRREEQERRDRKASYDVQLAGIHGDVIVATEAAGDGNISEALELLDSVVQKLGNLAKSAAAAQDEDYARSVQNQRQTALEAAEAIRGKHEETKAVALEHLSKVKALFGPVAPTGMAPPKPQQEEPAAPPESAQQQPTEPPQAPAPVPGDVQPSEAPAPVPPPRLPGQPVPPDRPARPPG